MMLEAPLHWRVFLNRNEGKCLPSRQRTLEDFMVRLSELWSYNDLFSGVNPFTLSM